MIPLQVKAEIIADKLENIIKAKTLPFVLDASLSMKLRPKHRYLDLRRNVNSSAGSNANF